MAVDLRDPAAVEEWLKQQHTLVIDSIVLGDVEMHTTCGGLTDLCTSWDLCGRCAGDDDNDDGHLDGIDREDVVIHGVLHRWDEIAWTVKGDDCIVIDTPLATSVYGMIVQDRSIEPGEYEITDFGLVGGDRKLAIDVGRRL